MRVLFPVNEFNELGYMAMPLMVYLSGKLVLWSPMASFIDDLHAKSKLIFNSNDLIDMIDEGYVQIAARERWITDVKYRNEMPFHRAHFTDFDFQIKRRHENYKSFLKKNNPVYIVQEEKGKQWAKKTIQSKQKRNMRIVELARKYLENIDCIPLGTKEKIVRVENDEARLIQLLRDAKNTMLAVEETECDILAFWHDDLNLFATIADEPIKKPQPERGSIDTQKLKEMCDYFRIFPEIKNAKSFKKNIKKKGNGRNKRGGCSNLMF